MSDEEVSLAVLKAEVARLSLDFYAHAKRVDDYIVKILDFMSEEIGARKAREEALANHNASSELTWSKVMAMAALIGAVTSLPTIIHLVHP